MGGSDRSVRPGEFEAIARWFAPLAVREPGALALADDAAVLAPAPGNTFVLTVDMLVAGVHFLPGDPPDQVARKLLRVNLSDLAAMGAVPRAYLLAVALPAETDSAWFDAFAQGLAADQEEFGVALAGGDTTGTPGPLSLSLTALGEVPIGTEIRRSGARPGEDVYVSGTVGDAALALAVMQGRAAVADAAEREFLIARYRLPAPRTALGPALRGLASAMIDVSDGLLADLGHVCDVSAVAAEVDFAALPLSPAAAALVASDPAWAETVVSGGDDYELLFTAPPAAAPAISALSARVGVPVTRIGRIREGRGAVVRDAAGRPLQPARSGWQHF